MSWDWDDIKPKKESSFKKRLREMEENDSVGTVISHSPLYHRYFEDYSETAVTLPNGRTKIKRVYVGKYYSRKCSDRAWVGFKLLYIGLFLSALLLYLLAMCMKSACNNAWYPAVPGLLSALAVVLLLAQIIACTVSKRQLTTYGFGQFSTLMLLSLITGGIVLLYAICCFVFGFLNPGETVHSLVTGGIAAASAIAFALIALIEHSADYTSTASNRTPDENGVVIS